VPRVLVTADDGEVFWSEGVKAADFSGDHFRRCLADRLGWAVADAEGPSHVHTRPVRPAPELGGCEAVDLGAVRSLAA
jgi:hypothetical protein